jgi:uncharacterized OB-fold protein
MNCQNCHTEVGPEAAFCIYCGTKIAKSEETPLQADSEYHGSSSVTHVSPAGVEAAAVQNHTTYADMGDQPLGVGKYLLMWLVASIPIVNIIMMIVWSVSSKNKNQKNFAIAALIWFVIITVLTVMFTAVLGLVLPGLYQYMY